MEAARGDAVGEEAVEESGPSVTPPQLSASCVVVGYLFKRKGGDAHRRTTLGGLLQFNRRYFSIDFRKLCIYYASESTSKRVSVPINFNEIESVRVLEDAAPIPEDKRMGTACNYGFQVCTASRVLELYSETAPDMQAWIKVFEAARHRSNASVPPPLPPAEERPSSDHHVPPSPLSSFATPTPSSLNRTPTSGILSSMIPSVTTRHLTVPFVMEGGQMAPLVSVPSSAGGLYRRGVSLPLREAAQKGVRSGAKMVRGIWDQVHTFGVDVVEKVREKSRERARRRTYGCGGSGPSGRPPRPPPASPHQPPAADRGVFEQLARQHELAQRAEETAAQTAPTPSAHEGETQTPTDKTKADEKPTEQAPPAVQPPPPPLEKERVSALQERRSDWTDISLGPRRGSFFPAFAEGNEGNGGNGDGAGGDGGMTLPRDSRASAGSDGLDRDFLRVPPTSTDLLEFHEEIELERDGPSQHVSLDQAAQPPPAPPPASSSAIDKLDQDFSGLVAKLPAPQPPSHPDSDEEFKSPVSSCQIFPEMPQAHSLSAAKREDPAPPPRAPRMSECIPEGDEEEDEEEQEEGQEEDSTEQQGEGDGGAMQEAEAGPDLPPIEEDAAEDAEGEGADAEPPEGLAVEPQGAVEEEDEGTGEEQFAEQVRELEGEGETSQEGGVGQPIQDGACDEDAEDVVSRPSAKEGWVTFASDDHIDALHHPLPSEPPRASADKHPASLMPSLFHRLSRAQSSPLATDDAFEQLSGSFRPDVRLDVLPPPIQKQEQGVRVEEVDQPGQESEERHRAPCTRVPQLPSKIAQLTRVPRDVSSPAALTSHSVSFKTGLSSPRSYINEIWASARGQEEDDQKDREVEVIEGKEGYGYCEDTPEGTPPPRRPAPPMRLGGSANRAAAGERGEGGDMGYGTTRDEWRPKALQQTVVEPERDFVESPRPIERDPRPSTRSVNEVLASLEKTLNTEDTSGLDAPLGNLSLSRAAKSALYQRFLRDPLLSSSPTAKEEANISTSTSTGATTQPLGTSMRLRATTGASLSMPPSKLQAPLIYPSASSSRPTLKPLGATRTDDIETLGRRPILGGLHDGSSLASRLGYGASPGRRGYDGRGIRESGPSEGEGGRVGVGGTLGRAGVGLGAVVTTDASAGKQCSSMMDKYPSLLRRGTDRRPRYTLQEDEDDEDEFYDADSPHEDPGSH
ncbi:unnamed protein product [Vitrella brassicaformis CCMP3155]|uniref:PH domain-containing protein n=1 Tax=Vitrella brassicaformis (strain CCMP3155) TaxID=1169540 RepID=A0A0G4GEH3_VITBC|nr:unnamed protein product [Vitrella brassicaformis CCMP3155]|eukprot:CEM27541.1 unnamed protein product [Vitrella brassicaformis CCMP3155]